MTKSMSVATQLVGTLGCRPLFASFQSYLDHPLRVTLNYVKLKYPISFVLDRFLETDLTLTGNTDLKVCGHYARIYSR